MSAYDLMLNQLHAIRNAVPGKIRGQLLASARDLAAAGILPSAAVEAALVFTARQAGLDGTIARLTVQSGIDSAPKPQ